MNKLGKGPLVDATCQISNVWAFWFQRRRCLNKLLTHGRTHARTHARTDNGRRTNTYHKSSPWHFVPGELKTSRISRRQYNLFLENYPAFKGLKLSTLNDYSHETPNCYTMNTCKLISYLNPSLYSEK